MNLNCADYQNNMPYPDRADHEIITFGKVGFVMQALPRKTFLADLLAIPELAKDPVAKSLLHDSPSKSIIECLGCYGFSGSVSVNEETYNAAMQAYNAHSNELYAQFDKDLIEECGLQDIPSEMRSPILNLAYEKGHSAGLSEYANYAFEFTQMAEPLLAHYRATAK